MGLEIKKKGTKYQIKSTISDGRLHLKAWITEDEAKVVLIHERLHEFVEKVIEIDMSFPHKYRVNDVYQIAYGK